MKNSLLHLGFIESSVFLKAILALSLLFLLIAKTHAETLNCQFTHSQEMGLKSIQIKDHMLILNDQIEIPLEKNRVKCGNFGEQIRFDGMAYGYQIILRSCTTEAKFEGDLIDSINWVGASLICD